MSFKTKFLFLDIDGVLNADSTTTEVTPEGFTFVEDRLIEKLKRIIDATNAKVVLSSDWRFEHPRFDDDNPDAKMGLNLKLLIEKLASFGINLYGMTSVFRSRRGEEITYWLEQNECRYGGIDNINYVILDDLPWHEFLHHEEHFVNTDDYVGLTDENVEEAIAILNKES